MIYFINILLIITVCILQFFIIKKLRVKLKGIEQLDKADLKINYNVKNVDFPVIEYRVVEGIPYKYHVAEIITPKRTFSSIKIMPSEYEYNYSFYESFKKEVIAEALKDYNKYILQKNNLFINNHEFKLYKIKDK